MVSDGLGQGSGFQGLEFRVKGLGFRAFGAPRVRVYLELKSQDPKP